MARNRQRSSAGAYTRRLLEDQYAQEQLRNAIVRLGELYRRAAGQGGRAAEDKKLYGKAREAATSIRSAIGAVQEPPPRPKRTGPKIIPIALAVAGALLFRQRRRSRTGLPPDSGTSSSSAASNGNERTAFEAVGTHTDG
jgi:hypothetical protein